MKYIPLFLILVLYHASNFCNLSLQHKETTENRWRGRIGRIGEGSGRGG
jgi:hypothetical protein